MDAPSAERDPHNGSRPEHENGFDESSKSAWYLLLLTVSIGG